MSQPNQRNKPITRLLMIVMLLSNPPSKMADPLLEELLAIVLFKRKSPGVLTGISQ